MPNQSTFQVYSASAGSGKTYTLVKSYLTILLQSSSDFHFQKILAITFTNKAAAEMKERIIENLLDFSKLDVHEDNNDMFRQICEEVDLTSEEVKTKSKRILSAILENYTAFQIKTIDSFTNKIVKSFAYDLGLPLDFEVVLDTSELLEEAVDVVLSKIGKDMALTEVLLQFAKQKTLEDKSWDISLELKNIAKLLLVEDDFESIKKLQNKSFDDFKKLNTSLRKQQQEIEKKFKEIGEKGLRLIDDAGIAHNYFAYSDLPNFFKKLIVFKNLGTKGIDFDGRLAKNIEKNTLYSASNKKIPQSSKDSIDSIEESLKDLYYNAENLYTKEFSNYYLQKEVLKNLIPLAVLKAIGLSLEQIKTEQNLQLNAEFNQLINSHLKNQPIAFIYEKIGEKFKHYFIDEMQDTSVLQWENLIPLVDNALSELDSSLLLVGDAKQAIYRWRGGKAEQFIQLADEKNSDAGNPFIPKKEVFNLETNYRSHAEIINFNNDFFTYVSNFFQEPSYTELYKTGNKQNLNAKKGGYVQIDFVEKTEELSKEEVVSAKVYDAILGLDKAFSRNEICILVRKRKDGVAVANYLAEKGVEIVSSETLLLKNNAKINFIIHLLRYLGGEEDSEAKLNVLFFLYDFYQIQEEKHSFLSRLIDRERDVFFKSLEEFQVYFQAQNFYRTPFYESIEQIIRSFHLATTSDAYLQFFLDFVFEFGQKQSNKKEGFLEYWELKKDTASIVSAANENAVRIMTVHKSKGLEFPVVIFAFDIDIYKQINPTAWFSLEKKEGFQGFESVLIPASSGIKNTGKQGEQIFEDNEKALELDNFNLLYVALTRAKEQLYIILDKNIPKDSTKYYSQFFQNYLLEINQGEQENYCFGNPKRISKKERSNFNTVLQQEFCSSSWQEHQIHIVTNNEGQGLDKRQDAILYGNIIHEILSKIYTEKDIEVIINEFIEVGALYFEDKEELVKLLLKMVNHKELKSYFEPDKKISTECEIINEEGQILIPDRLVFTSKNEVVIIDYKTGNKEKKHELQVQNYAAVLEKMNLTVVEKILVYLDKEIEVLKVA